MVSIFVFSFRLAHPPPSNVARPSNASAMSLEAKRVVDLANPPAVIPPGEIVFKTPTGKYVCSVCGYVYDPAEYDGVAFEDLPADWRCPRCRQPKDKFNRV